MRHLIPLIVLFSSTLFAAEPAAPPSTLTVTGHGQTATAPDRAVVHFGVHVSGKEAAEVQNNVNQKMQAVLEAVKQLGIDPKQIQTSTLSLSAITSARTSKQSGIDEQFIVGYQATNSIQVQLDDLSKIGSVIDAGVKAGANTIDGITFQLKNDTEAKNAALKDAADNAKSKAQALASALNLNLDVIDEVSESGAEVGPPRPMLRAMAQAATPIQPGQVEIDAHITVRYRVSSAGAK